MIASGDAKAVAIFEEYKRNSDERIPAINQYRYR